MRVSKAALVGLALLVLLPFVIRYFFSASEKYYLHLLIQILLWAFIYTGWSLMGRFGLTSLADLGQWWEADTGLPIPLGAILARKGVVDPGQRVAGGLHHHVHVAPPHEVGGGIGEGGVVHQAVGPAHLPDESLYLVSL